MNYRHAYHAGNFADVLKHVVLARIIDYLKHKEAPFRVIDTHAGRGRYEIASREADKTGEWRTGIGRLLGPGAAPLPAQVAHTLAPYLAAVTAQNSGPALSVYPGSPLIAQHLMRAQDALVVNELHPVERDALQLALGRDRRVKVMGLDGWTALKSLLPPKERRGVVLIDPPFEEEGELPRLAAGLAEGLRRFETGTFMAWYPIKDPKPVARFQQTLSATQDRPLLMIELMIHRASNPDRLNGCGLIVANPPYTLQAEIAGVLPELSRRMAQAGGEHRVAWLGAAPEETHKPGPEPKRRMRSTQ